MINSTCPNNNDVLSEVVGLVEIHHHVTLDLIDIINISEDGLSHHVLPKYIVVHVFHKCFHVVIVSCL